MSRLLLDPLDNLLSLSAVFSDLAGALSEQLQARSLMAQTMRLIGETTAGDPIEYELALPQPLWGEGPLRAALLDLIDSGRFPAPLARLSVILTDLVPVQVERLSLFTHAAAVRPTMPTSLRTRYTRHTYQARLIAPDHPLPEHRFVWCAAAV